MTSPLPRLVTIMGSGETAPTMMKVHRDLITRVSTSGRTARAVVLDTPYGFQENAPELAARAQEYFRTSVGHPIEVAGLQRLEGLDPIEMEHGLDRVRQAQYVFAGPGSPTYALRQWRGTPLSDLIAHKINTGGAVTFASAAALTLGRVTVPVYEIYKVGEEPHWLEGLDVLSSFGLSVAVIPHYDNTEGGHHDTRFCYLGERRLAQLEAELPDDTYVLGVDEHTGVVMDLDSEVATVVGNGRLTVRVRGRSLQYAAGTTLALDALRFPSLSQSTTTLSAAPRVPSAPGEEPSAARTQSLWSEAQGYQQRFEGAMDARDAVDAARAALALESAIVAWSADTLQSDETDRARALLRAMIVRLGDAAVEGLRDPVEVWGPLMEILLDVRAEVRADRRFDLSDLIRDRVVALGIEVRDTAHGAQWVFSEVPRAPSAAADESPPLHR